MLHHRKESSPAPAGKNVSPNPTQNATPTLWNKFRAAVVILRHWILAVASANLYLFGIIFAQDKALPAWMRAAGVGITVAASIGVFTLAHRLAEADHRAREYEPSESDQTAFLVGYDTALLNLDIETRTRAEETVPLWLTLHIRKRREQVRARRGGDL